MPDAVYDPPAPLQQKSKLRQLTQQVSELQQAVLAARVAHSHTLDANAALEQRISELSRQVAVAEAEAAHTKLQYIVTAKHHIGEALCVRHGAGCGS